MPTSPRHSAGRGATGRWLRSAWACPVSPCGRGAGAAERIDQNKEFLGYDPAFHSGRPGVGRDVTEKERNLDAKQYRARGQVAQEGTREVPPAPPGQKEQPRERAGQDQERRGRDHRGV